MSIEGANQRLTPGGRILVTGGAGFIGANLVPMLLSRGYRVTVLDNLSAGKQEYLDGLDIEFIEGSILDPTLVERLVSNHDGVIHLAAQTGVPGSLADPRHDQEVNVLGTLNLLEECRLSMIRLKRNHRGPKFVFASSNAPLGRQPPPATEDKAPLPISPYGASKLAGEAYCLAYEGAWGLSTVVLRFGNIYGPFSSHKSSVIARFIADIVTKGEITIEGDGHQTRDFIYVADLCAAIVLALESDVRGEVFQIATGVGTSILELATLVRQVTGGEVRLNYGTQRAGDIQENYSVISKAQKTLGWNPTTTLAEGLRKTWEWFNQ